MPLNCILFYALINNIVSEEDLKQAALKQDAASVAAAARRMR